MPRARSRPLPTDFQYSAPGSRAPIASGAPWPALRMRITACRLHAPSRLGARLCQPDQRQLTVHQCIYHPQPNLTQAKRFCHIFVLQTVYLPARLQLWFSIPQVHKSSLSCTRTGTFPLEFQSITLPSPDASSSRHLKRPFGCPSSPSRYLQPLSPLLLQSTYQPCPAPPLFRRANISIHKLYTKTNVVARWLHLVPSLHSGYRV